MEDKAYLEPDFDPNQLKVAQLRGILSEHDVDYPSNAKKAQLIKLFVDEIKPQAVKLLKKYKLDSKHASNAGFIKGDKTPEVDLDEPVPEKKTRNRKTSRSTKAKSISVEPTEEPTESENDAEKDSTEETKAKLKVEPKDDPKRKVEKSTRTTRSKLSVTTEASNDEEQEKSPVSDITNTSNTVEENFSSKNPFQSPPENQKKRKHKSDGSTVRAKRVKSPTSEEQIPLLSPKLDQSRKLPRSIFESDSEEGELLSPKKSPFKVTKSPSKTSPNTKSSTKEVKNVTNMTNPKLNKLPVIDAEKNSVTKVKKSPKTTSVKPLKKTRSSTVKKLTESSFEELADESFNSIKEEQDHFDDQLAKMENIEKPLPKTIGLDLDLASELGIKVEGYQKTPRKSTVISTDSIQHQKTSSESTPKTGKVSTPGKVLSPKPRIAPTNEAASLSDEESEDESEVELEESVKESESSIEIETKKGSKKRKAHLGIVPLFFSFLTWIFLLSLGLFGYWYREQLFLIGYCGHEINKTTFPNTDNAILQVIGDYLDENFKPSCVPCPSHARCFSNLELGCFEDFVEYAPWNNVIFPTNKKCIPDSKKAEKLEIMIEVALDLLRTKNANRQCGKSENIEEAGIKLEDLHDLLLSMKAPYITTFEFEQLWNRSVVELEKEPDVIVGFANVSSARHGASTNNTATENYDKKNKILRSTSLSNISLRCQVKNSIAGSLIQHKYNIIGILLLFIAFKIGQFKYKQHHIELIKIDIIYREVLSKLQQQTRLNRQDNSKVPYIGSTQLRDLILANEHNLNKRVQLWNKIVNKVDHNTNVQSRIIEDHGEIIKVWHWISDLGH
jgi:hypothetical protein